MNEAHVIDCEEALRRLFEYLDAELHGEPQREMEQHLERCRSCFSRVEFEKRDDRYKKYRAQRRSRERSAELLAQQNARKRAEHDVKEEAKTAEVLRLRKEAGLD